MSEKRKKGKPESKKAEPKRVRSEFIKPKGSPPPARVSSRHGTVMVERAGKGFSMGELAGASLPLRMARRWGISTDNRRRSVLERNVQALRGWFVPQPRNEQLVRPNVARREKSAKKRPVRKKKAPK